MKAALLKLADTYKAEGYRLLTQRLKRAGFAVNHKRVYRLYVSLNLHLRIKRRKRLPEREALKLIPCTAPNQCWSMDFMSDSLEWGRKFRTLNIIDDFNREVLHIEIGTSLPSQRVVNVLQRLIDWQGKPAQIRVDNGPEYIAKSLRKWCEEQQITLLYIQPGKPTQNAYVERFNGTYRAYVLDAWLFRNLREVERVSEEFRMDYNTQRPHSSLNYQTPEEYKNEFYKKQLSPQGEFPLWAGSQTLETLN